VDFKICHNAFPATGGNHDALFSWGEDTLHHIPPHSILPPSALATRHLGLRGIAPNKYFPLEPHLITYIETMLEAKTQFYDSDA